MSSPRATVYRAVSVERERPVAAFGLITRTAGEGARIADLARRLLPGERLSWLELAEEIAFEHEVRVERMIDLFYREHTIVRARHHYWGALRGAGYTYRVIAEVLGVEPDRVQGGVRRAAERLGITATRAEERGAA